MKAFRIFTVSYYLLITCVVLLTLNLLLGLFAVPAALFPLLLILLTIMFVADAYFQGRIRKGTY
ncbi:hypothetical protein ADIS_4380 [Lunatimonas lonarensis]|uniref:Uncharacterized protein n=1 Tax=Lunatimonas lonarensis TaxID=1232681 RepID=R7ZMH3_9BACT|nr:hypothetical protein [Lunatimonas lonarensis]EON75209.1 hypothetical protein ADIS_4380 [Lunatimonas lonarensis]